MGNFRKIQPDIVYQQRAEPDKTFSTSDLKKNQNGRSGMAKLSFY